MVPITMSAGYLNVVNNFWPKSLYLLVGLSITLMILMAIVFVEAFRKWYRLYSGVDAVRDDEAVEDVAA